jgi:putative membrane protein
MLSILLAALHLIALGLGLGAVLTRGTALREVPDPRSLQRALRADMLWGIAAALWIVTGLLRYLTGMEKGADYYNSNYLFLVKMALLGLVLALEIWPMMTLTRWRLGLKRGVTPAAVVVPASARRISIISHIEALVVVLMVFAAVAMARGYGMTAR